MSETTLEINQHLARRLLIEGATLVFLDVPPGTEFGIDLKSWNTGDKFKGVKMIPPGLHFVHYSSVSEYDETAPRKGFIHNFKKSEFVVRKWDPQAEDISVSEISEEEIARLKSNLLNLDKFLGPYPFEIWNKWKLLTTKFTEDLVLKLTPESGQIRSALEMISCDVPYTSPQTKKRRSRTVEEKEDDLLPRMKPSPGTELRFTEFPDKVYPDDATPEQITHHCLDSSYTLEKVLSKCQSSNNFIGELQFAFVCFLIGHSLEAFEHWKRLVTLVCSCDDAVPRHRELFSDFVSVIECQLIEIPQDFLVDIVANNNLVYCNLRNLFRTLQAHEDVDGRLKSKMTRFKEKLTQEFQWDFLNLDKEDDDEAPVVVTLDSTY